jgi:hypothetical protein
VELVVPHGVEFRSLLDWDSQTWPMRVWSALIQAQAADKMDKKQFSLKHWDSCVDRELISHTSLSFIFKGWDFKYAH